MLISIVSHYYNNQRSIEGMLESFQRLDSAYPNYFDFILVDDHSSEKIDNSIFEGIKNLRVFRIVEDIAWNMPAARNIGVKEAKSDKILLIDVDHTIKGEDIDSFVEDAGNLKRGEVARFKRFRLSPEKEWYEIKSHINSFMIHKADFDEIGGYDEQFSGRYGGEDSFFKFCCERHNFKDIVVDTPLYVSGKSTAGLDRDNSENRKIYLSLVERNIGKPQKTMLCSWDQIYPTK
ncbi:glycosyltransferase [Sphingomonas sp. Leaf17]|uniref:glycosyltransferase n=1 Tax=Sphingomonas sp. Leaf17 TaxID=1735683 RepID=UPI0009E903C8|nr:glycosyltransferase [Sphingomonas sp. Leaf17]